MLVLQELQNLSFVKAALDEKNKKIQLSNCNNSALAILAANFFLEKSESLLILTHDLNSAEKIRDDLEILIPSNFAFFPSDELLPFDDKEANPAMRSLRLEAINRLTKGEKLVLLTTAHSLCKRIASPNRFQKNRFLLKKGEAYLFELLIEELIDFGFQRTDSVEKIGTFSVRGGLIDVYPWVSEEAIRIEFFGDEIESIREFDLWTQRSIQEIDEVELFPSMNSGLRESSILDYLNAAPIVSIEDDLLKDRIRAFETEAMEIVQAKSLEKSDYHQNYFGAEFLISSIEKKTRFITNLHKRNEFFQLQANTIAHFNFDGEFKKFLSHYKQNLRNEIKTIVLCENDAQRERLLELFDDHEVAESTIYLGALHQGLSLLDDKLEIINEHEIFNRFKRNKAYKKFKRAEALRSLNALSFNDYVVHIDHGLGQFKGLRRITLNNAVKESLLIEYDKGDKVYVGIDKINRVQKYSSEEGNPKLNKIGGKEWDRIKQKTKKQVEVIAKELVELYAERALSEGIQYSPDTKWQHELEASFEYQDTADQILATEAVKKDMEAAKSMDRLVCGDVGFGKTEIAIRAAFKATMDSKQVAVLVPTTILAQQHYETFKSRLANFPVKVELLSRFRSSIANKKVIEDAKKGAVDIIIGTHRITSTDVGFKDLGLIIIDEEQRFGVKHKERLKELKKGADVLTLTATPIPRTLQQSMVGVRGISNIETAPVNRLPIATEIISWDEEQIYSAIMREMERGGQIYFVHNRVQTIEQVASMIQKIVPKAKLVIAHGQMKERELEEVMHDFKAGKYDILLATMIIENGLDIPNVNTILVNHAERFGLSQLYQLRGRVGRSQRQAYAYLITPVMNRMTEGAIKRLYALEEFSELGSGIKISMRDLEIRGAGSLLGHQQSGHINAVGYDLYLEILEEAIAELKDQIDHSAGEIAKNKKSETQFDVDLDALIPDNYVANARERMTLYQRLSKARGSDEVNDLEAELKDRFGTTPEPVINLIKMLHIRNEASEQEIEKVDIKQNVMILKYAEAISENSDRIQSLIQNYMKQKMAEFQFMDKKGFAVKVFLKGKINSNEKLNFALEFLRRI